MLRSSLLRSTASHRLGKTLAIAASASHFSNVINVSSTIRNYTTPNGVVLPDTMKAAVYEGPLDIICKEVPIPKITHPEDALIKVTQSSICGTELHFYRGHLATSTGHIMGHETVGEVIDVGSQVTNFKPGDKVISCFTTQCGKCWYCVRGYSSKCYNTAVFGTTALDGGQAQYLRIPQADGTLFHKPPGLDDNVALLMCDIFPTGYFCVSNFTKKFPKERVEEAVAVQFGLGPVGQCALASAKELGIKKLYAVDSIPSRLEVAEKFGAIPLVLGKDNIKQILLDATENRGADVVFEIVGSKEAIGMAFDVVRPFGYISSIGYHHDALPFSGLDCYMKNVTIQFGRCPAWSLFPESLPILQKNQHLFKDFIDTKIDIEDISKGYDIFDKHLVRKVVCEHHHHHH
ncbi:hypothetical protein DASC09_020670 [Saccharomycopsis crataegensis]|uniref:Alcohol dehydrogenase n=1 Tax=Saccharomycopsis crataegensis TaxID=43959 RepID=A0AAV5QJF0_9ASCO|nr:hypothetical protein DASC09_020670 [Saccharomycopsis crataegensis]